MTGQRYDALLETLRGLGSTIVAFSGGVDSTFLLAAAHGALGPEVLALTTRSPTFPARELAFAQAFAAERGIRHLIADSDELAIPGYAQNPVNRCYFCKHTLFEICRAQAKRLGFASICYGAIADDIDDYRPGHQAALELAVRAPLAEGGWTKDEIREASRALGLPTWNKPQAACLSSRFPHGTAITAERLARVEAAEEVLRAEGFRNCRVRFHEPVARVEIDAADFPRLMEPAVRARVIAGVRAQGFKFVTLDLEGFRSGSLNPELTTIGRHSGPVTRLTMSVDSATSDPELR